MRTVLLDTHVALWILADDAIFMLGKLPAIHRDPFDRLLVAHAIVHGWELATVDRRVMDYPVRIFR